MDQRKKARVGRKKREKAERDKLGTEAQKKGCVRNKVGTDAEEKGCGGKKWEGVWWGEKVK